MNAFSLTDVAHSSPNGPLFDTVTLGIDDGEKIGLIGRNGSGKSTFLRLLTGEVEPESGTVVSARGTRVSVLPQNPRVVPGLTIGEYLAADLPAGHRVANVPPEADHDSAHHADALVSYAAICDQLGLTDPTLALETLSGGMLKKAALARCLAHESEFLILDEPTNHLDIDTIAWLESRLRERTGGFVLVTHDRYILDAVCDTILEIDRESVYRYPGSYSVYLERREERRNALEAAETRRNTILKAELAWLQRGARARTGKDKRRTERVAALLDDGLEADPTVSEMPAVKRRQGKKVLELRDIAKSYDGVRVFEGLSYKFRAGEKIGVIGPNGSGKSTLLDVVSGRMAPDTGEIERGETTVIGYFDQTGERIETRLTVLEYMKQHAERVRINAETTLTAESFLERFLFPRSMFAQPLNKLSGGEFRRLMLVRLLATAPNFLLLDEPTNDLDLDTLRVLEQYLEQFAGCALIVSHDRALLDRVTESLFVFTSDGKIVPFVGDYDAYRAQLAESESTRKRAATRLENEARTASEANRTRRTARTGLSFREQREYEQLPDELEVIEAELKGLESFFADAALDPGTLAEKTRRYHELRDTVEKKTKRWEELAERTDG